MNYLTPSLITSLLFSSAGVFANTSTSDKTVLEHIEVQGVQSRLQARGILKDSIARTELIDAEQLKNMQAANLTEAIDKALGIRVSNECSMCGAKRIMINGMKGEHTNVLIDGVPMHTMLSGFYGMDSIATSGIGTIEIARGAGASLTAPEAIGGTVNLVSQKPAKNAAELDMAVGNYEYRKVSMVAMGVSEDERSSISAIAQQDSRDQFDGDHNGVSESPLLDNQSIAITLSHDLSLDTTIKARYGRSDSEVFGGPVLGDTTSSIAETLASVNQGEAERLFVDNQVDGRYVGHPWETAEWVDTQREEWLVSLLHSMNDKLTVDISYANVEHIQDSFYESIDYFAQDDMQFITAKLYYALNDQHLITLGVDHRDEQMRSHSAALADNPLYMSDSFDYTVSGLYIQETYTPSIDFELALAVRFDRITADFIANRVTDNEIDETLVSPRLDIRWFHHENWTSRFSVGQGYRAPLSFFESDHGILDAEKGYLVDVHDVERSIGYNYSLNHSENKLNATLSLAYTQVDNLATLSHNETGTPVLGQLSEQADVWAWDLALSYQLLEQLQLGASIETYRYNDEFKSSFGIAPTEKRASINLEFVQAAWTVTANYLFVPSRDLNDYGYEGFNDIQAQQPKATDVSSYGLLDFKVTYALTNNIKLYAGMNNALDYNQAADEASPLLFDSEGGYDVTYIYAPLRGRQAYLGFDYDF
ncbi:TonB-dependent receptor plug domain-containing protein [Pseudoalteromonas umbrosa]|uniref:TonB-dependent receptor plug domain-containing protein n=1 Tax=Pseudoalteromonas umbrosa TaxID=3048489 RepID=UPI0024C23FAC|nr:TonB-dependent receptor [Pseudoalteromonas sp. B95]MDK1290594.1 TonB-dependent receptor [Pseudoalteromonas sp. B95]